MSEGVMTLESLQHAREFKQTKFHHLFTHDLRIDRLATGERVVSTYRVMKGSNGLQDKVWRQVHKQASWSEDEVANYPAYEVRPDADNPFDDKPLAWYQRATNADEQQNVELAWKLLCNRRYFDHCRCCGVLHHVDRMADKVCETCIQDPLPKSEWNDHYLSEGFIKPITRDAMLEDEFIHAPHFHRLQMECLVQPDSVLGLMVCTLTWDKPQHPSANWKVVKQFSPPLSLNDKTSLKNEYRAILNNRRFFKVCHDCAVRFHKDHMHGDTCDSCMEDRGIRF